MTSVVDRNPLTTIRDLAANPIQSNRSNGDLRFEIILDNDENDPPINDTPESATTLEDTPLVFSTFNANAISVSDQDTFLGTNELTVTLFADQGTLTLPPTIQSNAAGDVLTFPDAAVAIGQQFTIVDGNDVNNVSSEIFTFVDATLITSPLPTEIPVDPTDSAALVSAAAFTVVNTRFPGATAHDVLLLLVP